MTLVVDSSIVVAALVQDDSNGVWAEKLLRSQRLFGPHLLPVEVTNRLRRAVLAGWIDEPMALRALMDLLQLPIVLYPYQPYALRAWELRHNVTPYDAWYVALAESLDMPLATLDRRLTQASGPRCEFVTPPLG